LRHHCNAVKVAILKNKVIALGSEIGQESKDELHCKLHDMMIPYEGKVRAEQECNGESSSNCNSEEMCWNKGNWLSFMANISAQIDYLGPLHLIWLD